MSVGSPCRIRKERWPRYSQGKWPSSGYWSSPAYAGANARLTGIFLDKSPLSKHLRLLPLPLRRNHMAGGARASCRSIHLQPGARTPCTRDNAARSGMGPDQGRSATSRRISRPLEGHRDARQTSPALSALRLSDDSISIRQCHRACDDDNVPCAPCGER